jgi:putative transposase
VFENPKSLKHHERKLKRCQRTLCRRKKGSRNRDKARSRLSRVYQRITWVREAALHKMTSWVVANFRYIGIEDLNVKGMVKNHCLAKSLSDASFGEIRRQLEYKSKLSGGHIALADRFYPSSKKCHVCGHILEELDLSVREWTCPQCGAHHDRDFNASVNLDDVARRDRETINAGGEGVRPPGGNPRRRPSKKQESDNRPGATLA